MLLCFPKDAANLYLDNYSEMPQTTSLRKRKVPAPRHPKKQISVLFPHPCDQICSRCLVGHVSRPSCNVLILSMGMDISNHPNLQESSFTISLTCPVAIAKDSNVPISTRARAAGDMISDKMDQHSHEVLSICSRDCRIQGLWLISMY